jgi:P27 family predicted phage terminase small subunit
MVSRNAKALPQPPEWLDGVALEKWNELIPKLVRMRTVGDVDGDVVAAYCEAWAEFVEARSWIEENGRIACGEKGGEYQHPMVGIKNKAVERMGRLGAQFGWSASARTGLKIKAETNKDNGKSRFFNA